MVFFYIIGMVPSSFMIYLYYHLYKLAAKGCELRQRMKEQIEKKNKQEAGCLLRSPPGEASFRRSGSAAARVSEPNASKVATNTRLDSLQVAGPSRTVQEPSRKTPKEKMSSDGSSDGPGISVVGTRMNNVSILAAGKKLYLKPSLVQYQAAILVGVLIAVYFFFITPCYAVYAYWFFCPSCVDESWIWYLYPWTGLLNSGLNPLLYFSLSKDFRKVLHPLRNKFVKAYNYLIELEYVTTT